MCVCDVAHVDIGKRAHVCAPLHVPVCDVVCGMLCARGDTRRMQAGPAASRRWHLTASPVYESSEGGEESAYDDRMSLERDGSCGACACTPSIRSQLPAGGSKLALRRLQSLHPLLTRRWA